ncbi:MAG: ribonuclease III [Spirochaetota bacterium]|nr:ribonuclease III [Spirochaetota bacterium]
MENKKEGRKQRRKKRDRQLNKLQDVIKVKFRDKSLLNRALTHRSYVNEAGFDMKDNEKLEYLGDSVLALVVNEYLFKRYEDYLEGDLAKIKSAVVSEATLAKVASEVKLGYFILISKGEERSGGRDRPSILANTLEAIIGAIYLDSGLKESKKFVLALLKRDIERIDNLSYLRDPKTTLQEFVQKRYKERPSYVVIKENGPDHKKEFTVKLVIHGRDMSIGVGSSKGKAELEAAKKVLGELEEGIISI